MRFIFVVDAPKDESIFLGFEIMRMINLTSWIDIVVPEGVQDNTISASLVSRTLKIKSI